MADATVGSRAPRVPRPRRVLPEFHPGLWSDHHAADKPPAEGRVLVVAGGGGDLPHSAAGSDGRPSIAVVGVRRSFHCGVRCVGTGFGTVLHPGRGPIAFFSRQIAPRHAKLATYERELIGLVQAVRHWWPYLWGCKFVVRTNHYSLKFLLDQRLSTILQHQWASKLLGFEFTIEYKSGSTNVVADALSRRDSEADGSLLALAAPTFQVFDDLRQELDADPAQQKLRKEAQADRHSDKWKMVDCLLTVTNFVYVPASSAHIQTLLAATHNIRA
jgi:hypothetical protein